MSTGLAILTFVVAAAVSLTTSWVLVVRLEWIGERLGLSEALLGILAALAADAPEITSAITALAHGQQRVGAGVVIGSNVFNLAALLGLASVVAGRIALHRKVVALGGAVAIWIAAVCLVVVLGLVPPVAGLILTVIVLGAYILALSDDGRRAAAWLHLSGRWTRWLGSAITEEEVELTDAIRPRSASGTDVVVAAASLCTVVGASVIMERTASMLGVRFAVPGIVVGGIVLAAVTSLPNAVAANYLASRGRGAATLSTALNSNNLNVVAGLLLPATLIGIGSPSAETTFVALWYVGLTAFALAAAYAGRGLRRNVGAVIIVAYAVFVVWLIVGARSGA